MELLLFLLKSILIGLLFGIPVGAVGTMTVGRTLKHVSVCIFGALLMVLGRIILIGIIV